MNILPGKNVITFDIYCLITVHQSTAHLFYIHSNRKSRKNLPEKEIQRKAEEEG